MEDSILQMQQAARQRVLQAHERSRRIVEQNERRPLCDPVPETPAPVPPTCGEPPKAGDSEQLLLLLLAFFLYKNGASWEVLLALLYLAL